MFARRSSVFSDGTVNVRCNRAACHDAPADRGRAAEGLMHVGDADDGTGDGTGAIAVAQAARTTMTAIAVRGARTRAATATRTTRLRPKKHSESCCAGPTPLRTRRPTHAYARACTFRGCTGG